MLPPYTMTIGRRACKVKIKVQIFFAKAVAYFIYTLDRILQSLLDSLLLPFPKSGNRKGVALVDITITGFLVSVAASVVAYYVCKWLDSHGKGK